MNGSTARPTAVRIAALIGNPNTGKSTLFNQLTGARQRVGNYPGVTVTRQSGDLVLRGERITLLDLPGAYSLAATSPDERVTADVLTGRQRPAPELAVCVVDASQIRRSLFLACQVMDFGVPLVIALNFIDEAEIHGLEINFAEIGFRIGAPVVPIAARSGRGLDTLRQTIASELARPSEAMRLPGWPTCVARSTQLLRIEIEAISNRILLEHELRRVVFDKESSYLDLIGYPEEMRRAMLAKIRQPILGEGAEPLAIESQSHYRFIDGVLDGVIKHRSTARDDSTRRLDAVLTHRLAGPVLFAAFMFLVFQGIYTLSTPMVGAIESVLAWIGGHLASWLAPLPVFRSLVCDGIIAGVGGVIVFVPQIALLFFFLALLEGSGYMARAAFLADRLFGWCGLNGKSFVPLLSGSACAVPGILAARTIEEPKARLITILITPLMSCSARLPVYLLLIGAFIEPRWGAGVAALSLFGIQAFGLASALATAWVINVGIFKSPPQHFILELPPYRMPSPRDISSRMLAGTRDFLHRAGTLILFISVLVWALLYFPHRDEVTPAVQVEQSWLGQAGKAIEPVFALAGFDWKITVGILASFPAREVIVSSLGIIYNAEGSGQEGLPTALRDARWGEGPRTAQPVFTTPTVLAMMVFFALCMQCSSTVVVMAREVGWRLAAFAFLYQSAVAWLASVLVYQIGTRL